MGGKPCAGGDAVLVDDTEVGEAHVARVEVVGEAERVEGAQPVVVGMAALVPAASIDGGGLGEGKGGHAAGACACAGGGGRTGAEGEASGGGKRGRGASGGEGDVGDVHRGGEGEGRGEERAAGGGEHGADARADAVQIGRRAAHLSVREQPPRGRVLGLCPSRRPVARRVGTERNGTGRRRCSAILRHLAHDEGQQASAADPASVIHG